MGKPPKSDSPRLSPRRPDDEAKSPPRSRFEQVSTLAKSLLRATFASAERFKATACLKLFLWLGFVLIKIDAIWGKSPISSQDGRIWADIAQYPFFSRAFLVPRRPIVLPLIFKLVSSDSQLISLQVILSCIAWGVLATSLARFLSGAPSLLVFALVLLNALVSPVHSWDLVIRSESTSHSLLILCIAGATEFIRSLAERAKPPYASAVLAGLAGCLAAFSRDTHSYVIWLFVLAIACSSWLFLRPRQTHRKALIAAGVLCAGLSFACYASQLNARASLRYDFPLINVVFRRVLPNQGKRDYFVSELGMPMSRELRGCSRKWASWRHRYAFRAPELETFRDWIATSGYAGYQRYLLTHLGSTFSEALGATPEILTWTDRSAAEKTRTPLSDYVDGFAFYAPLVKHASAVTLAIAVLAALSALTGKVLEKRLAIVTLTLVGACVSQLYISYHGDAMEVGRHSVVVGLLFRLMLVFGLTLCAAILQRMNSGWRLQRHDRSRAMLAAGRSTPRTDGDAGSATAHLDQSSASK